MMDESRDRPDVMDIMTLLIAGDEYDFTIYPKEVGRTLQNYITQIKTDAAYDAIKFTLDYLREKKVGNV